MRADRPEVCALFVSGYSADIIHGKGIFDEGLHYLAKPVHPSDLLRRVRELLDETARVTPIKRST